jgi:hypothetical protein
VWSPGCTPKAAYHASVFHVGDEPAASFFDAEVR